MIIGVESQLHSIQAEVFEGKADATAQQLEANAATLLILKREKQNSKEKRRRQQVLKVGIG